MALRVLGTDEGIAEWLGQLELERYAPLFRAHAVRGDVLHLLSREDLEEVGVESVGHRVRILKAIAQIPPSTPRPMLSLELGQTHPTWSGAGMGSVTSPAESNAPHSAIPGMNDGSATAFKQIKKLLSRVESLEKQNRKLLVKYKEDQPLPTPTAEVDYPEFPSPLPISSSDTRRKRFISDSKSDERQSATLSGRVIQPVRVREGGTTPEVLAAAFRDQNLSGNPQDYQLVLVWDSDASNDYKRSYKLQPNERPQEMAKILAGGKDDLRFVLVRKGKKDS